MKKSNNSLLYLAGFLVVALGIMAYVTYTMPSSEKDVQTASLMKLSEGDDTEAIESDLNNTDFSNMDRELGDIDKELNSPSD